MSKNLEILVERKFKKDTYTIGKMYIVNPDGSKVYIMDIVEDKDRGLTQKDTLAKIKTVKVYNETAIPSGRYEITMSVKSPKFSNFTKYPYYKEYDGMLPRLLKVPGFEGILIHMGNSARSSAGCLIVGKNSIVGQVTESKKYFDILMKEHLLPAKQAGKKIFITIQ